MDFSRPCSTKCDPKDIENGDPYAHHITCHKVLHEVRDYVKRVQLVITPRHPEGTMPHKWVAEGWQFKKDGADTFRFKKLCRNCIEKEVERDMVHKDYLKACKTARGEDDRTYGQLMIQQAQG